MVEALKKIGENQLVLALALLGSGTWLAWSDKLSPEWLSVAFLIGALIGARNGQKAPPA